MHPDYPGVFDGAVRVASTDATNIFASERQIYGSSFSEFMGIPANRLTTDYWFPWYDGLTMSTWITIGAPSSNVGNANVQMYMSTAGWRALTVWRPAARCIRTTPDCSMARCTW